MCAYTKEKKMETLTNRGEFFFSIIVPIYNVEKYLSKCVTSLARQGYTGFEVIFVNDGSTDDSLEVLKRLLKDVFFRYRIIDQQNQGLSVARNAGFSYASGLYVLFLDSDDYLQDDALEYCHNLLHLNDSVNCLSFSRSYVDESYKTIERSFVRYNFSDEVKLIGKSELMSDLLSFQNISFTVIDKIFSHKFLSAFSPNIFEPGVNFEDHIFTFRAYQELSAVLVSKRRLLNYLVRGSSIMRTANLNMVNNYLVMLQKFVENSRLHHDQKANSHLIAQHLLIQIVSFYKALYEVSNLTAKNYRLLSTTFKQELLNKGLLPLSSQDFNVSKSLIAQYIASPFSSNLFCNKLFFYLLGLIGKG